MQHGIALKMLNTERHLKTSIFGWCKTANVETQAVFSEADRCLGDDKYLKTSNNRMVCLCEISILKWGVESPQNNLSRGLFIFLCQGSHHRLLKQDGFIWMFPGPVRRAQRAVGRQHQAPVPTVGQQLHLSQIRVTLYLPNQNTEIPALSVALGTPRVVIATNTLYLQDRGFDAGHGQDVIYLPAVEVGQADRSDEALPHQLLHGSPSQLVVYVVVQQGAVLLFREGSVSLSGR